MLSVELNLYRSLIH